MATRRSFVSVKTMSVSTTDNNARSMATNARGLADEAVATSDAAASSAAAAGAKADTAVSAASDAVSMASNAARIAQQAADTASAAAKLAQDAQKSAQTLVAQASSINTGLVRAHTEHDEMRTAITAVRADLERALAELRQQVDAIASAPGVPGGDGKSAYDLWLEQGNSGTVGEFLATLTGQPGSDGAPGRSVELRADGGKVQWRQEGRPWADLVALAALKGDPGPAATATQVRMSSARIATVIHPNKSVDLSFTWKSALPTSDYTVEVVEGAGALDQVTTVVKSKTAAGCVVTVTASSLLAVGAVLYAHAYL